MSQASPGRMGEHQNGESVTVALRSLRRYTWCEVRLAGVRCALLPAIPAGALACPSWSKVNAFRGSESTTGEQTANGPGLGNGLRFGRCHQQQAGWPGGDRHFQLEHLAGSGAGAAKAEGPRGRLMHDMGA